MLGLLYKDYIAVKGKFFLAALFGQFFLTMLLRFVVVDEEMDIIVTMLVLCVLVIFSAMLPFTFELSIMKADEGRKQKQYLSFPVSRRQYVASKYIFLAVAFYIVEAVAILEFIVCRINIKADNMMGKISSMQMLVTACVSVCMFVCSLELPFLIGLGVKKGKAAKEGLFFAFCFLFVAYFMFGVLSMPYGKSIVELVEYFTKHSEISMAVQVAAPIVSILSFYISYRISARIFERKELED